MTSQSFLHVNELQRTKVLCLCFMIVQKREPVRPTVPWRVRKPIGNVTVNILRPEKVSSNKSTSIVRGLV